jgi:hypothetical protein
MKATSSRHPSATNGPQICAYVEQREWLTGSLRLRGLSKKSALDQKLVRVHAMRTLQ